MVDNIGTRIRATLGNNRTENGTINGSETLDKGLLPLVTASLTFTKSTARISGANGTFANSGVSRFRKGDVILIAGANLNRGQFAVTGVDGTNFSYLAVDPPPKDEGPITVTIRTT